MCPIFVTLPSWTQEAAKVQPADANQGVKIHSQKASTSGDGSASGSVSTAPELVVKDTFMCSAPDLFDALMNEDKVRAYTQAEAKIDGKLGGKFTLFNGSVTGTITDLVCGTACKAQPAFKHNLLSSTTRFPLFMSEFGRF